MNNIFNIKQFLFAIKQINLKDEKKRSHGTNLGRLWDVLNPFLYMVVLSTYYSKVIVHDIDKFPVFVFTGVTIYNLYSNGTTGAMKALVDNKNLLIKSKLSIRTFIFQRVTGAFNEYLYSAIALIPILCFFKVRITWRIILVVPVLFITLLVVIGIGEILAVLYVYFDDINYLYSLLMTMVVFISGVFIPIESLPSNMHFWLSLNPVFLTIYLLRNSLIYGLQSHWTAWIKLLVWAIFSILIGNRMIEKNKNYIFNIL